MEDRREYYKEWHRKNREEELKKMRLRHQEKRIEDIERFKKYGQENKAKILIRKKGYYFGVRKTVLLHYGKGKIECACCGETEYHFMTIDHVNGNGRKHLENINVSLCFWLKRNKFPDGYQLLCLNCNQGRYRNGGKCPHQTKQTKSLTISEEWSSN